MALKLYKPGATIKFVPASEKDVPAPTTFYIKVESIETGLLKNQLFRYDFSLGSGKREVALASDECWLDYMGGRILKIENVEEDGKLTTIEGHDRIDAFLKSPFEGAYIIGTELMGFLLANSGLTEDEKKN